MLKIEIRLAHIIRYSSFSNDNAYEWGSIHNAFNQLNIQDKGLTDDP